MDIERGSNVIWTRELTRRQFLKEAVGAFAVGPVALRSIFAIGAKIPTSLTYNDLGELVINGDIVPWSSEEWFPLDESVARSYGRVQIYPFLRKYDAGHMNKFGQPSKAEQWQRDFAADLLRRLRNNPAEYNSAGFCHAVANAAVLETPPLEFTSTIYGQTINKIDRVAAMAVRHAGDIATGFTTTRDGIERSLRERFVNTRIPLVGNIPLDSSGRWFRVVYKTRQAADGSLWVTVTNLGKEDIEVSADEIRSLHLPDHINSRLVQHSTSNWINTEIDEDLLKEFINK